LLIPPQILYLFKTNNSLFNFKHCLNIFFKDYSTVIFYNIFKNKKKFKKYSYVGNFIFFNSTNIIPKSLYFLFLNKFFCFWPIKNFDSNIKKLIINIIQKQKQKSAKIFTLMSNRFLKINKLKHLILNVIKKKKKKKKQII